MSILLVIVIFSLILTEILAHLPLALLRMLQPPHVLSLAIVFILFAWGIGED